jgi:uncharacterized protein
MLRFDATLPAVQDASVRLRIRAFVGTAQVLGVLEDQGFRPLRERLPFEETAVQPATDADVRGYLDWSRTSSGRTSLDIGREPRRGSARVHLQASGLSRHTLLVGQSGSGKTFSLGVLLERVLLDTTLPIVVLDPNSDHVHLDQLRDRTSADRLRTPAWTDEEWSGLERAHAKLAAGIVVARDAATAVSTRIASGTRATVLDLGSLPDAAARHAASAGMLQHLWDTRRDRDPVLVVIDEAHDTCPAEPVTDAQREATQLAIALAGEGRKFGRHLLLATQRPQKLHPNVVSQCDNLVLLRMNSDRDVADVAGTFSHVPAGLLHRAPSFEQGMAIVGGPLVPHPTLLRIDGRVTVEGGADVPTDWAPRA